MCIVSHTRPHTFKYFFYSGRKFYTILSINNLIFRLIFLFCSRLFVSFVSRAEVYLWLFIGLCVYMFLFLFLWGYCCDCYIFFIFIFFLIWNSQEIFVYYYLSVLYFKWIVDSVYWKSKVFYSNFSLLLNYFIDIKSTIIAIYLSVYPFGYLNF